MDADPTANHYAVRMFHSPQREPCGVGVVPARRRSPGMASVIAPVGLIGVLVLGGCSHPAATAPASPSASSMPAAPGDSTSVGLNVYGITHGPGDFRLPAGLVVLDTMDQPNVVTLVLGPDAGTFLADWLRQHLPDAGYRVDAAGHGSVVFHGSTWSGSFTSDTRLAGLTLRRNR